MPGLSASSPLATEAPQQACDGNKAARAQRVMDGGRRQKLANMVHHTKSRSESLILFQVFEATRYEFGGVDGAFSWLLASSSRSLSSR
jgi:hypothetical protein